MALLQCLVCGDLVSPSDGPGSSSNHCVCGRAFAALNRGVLEVGGTGRAVWLDHEGAVTDRPPSDADGASATRRRIVPALL